MLIERTQASVLHKRDLKFDFGFSEAQQAGFALPVHTGDRFGKVSLIVPRLGQQSFRIKIASVYGFSCSVSNTRVLPALDAAHIKPYKQGGEHSISNGLFLRRDIHSVFDAGYATFDKDFRFVVSERIRSDFNNGSDYWKLHGSKLKLPQKSDLWPSQENLEWHRNERFRS